MEVIAWQNPEHEYAGMLLDKEDAGIILEFKIFNPQKEQSMEETVQAALQQIQDKKYEQTLVEQGIPAKRIRKYGFAFMQLK